MMEAIVGDGRVYRGFDIDIMIPRISSLHRKVIHLPRG